MITLKSNSNDLLIVMKMKKKIKCFSKSRAILSKLSDAVCGLDSKQERKAKEFIPIRVKTKLTSVDMQAKKISTNKDLDWLLDSDNFTSSEEEIYEEVKATPRRLLKRPQSPPPPIPTTSRPYSLQLRRSSRLKQKAREQSSLKSNLMDSFCSFKCFRKKPKSRPPSRQELDQKMYLVQQQARQTWPRFRKLDSDAESDSQYEEIEIRPKPKRETRKPPQVPPKPRPFTLPNRSRTSF